LVATALLAAVAGVFGGGVAGHLSSGGFEDPNSESATTAALLEREFGAREPNLILLVTARAGTVENPTIARMGTELAAELASERGVEQVVSFWGTGAPALRSDDGTQALVLANIAGDEDQVNARVEELSPRYTRATPHAEIAVGGFAEIFRQVGETIEGDLARAEAIAFPITLVLLILVFGSLVAASLPLAIGGISILGAFFVLRLIAEITDVSIFALNLVTMLGLGLAIDYSLFIVSRYREEFAAGLGAHGAAARTVRTAGRTVAFSGLTVALSLAALLVFPLGFLRSFAYAGIAVVLIAGVAAVVFLPALLAVLGHRVDKLALFRRRTKPAGEGFWHRIAVLVMRRPIPIATAVIALLLFLGTPFLRAQWGQPDDRVLPSDASAHFVSQEIRENFPTNGANALSVLGAEGEDPRTLAAPIDEYASELSGLEGVVAVEALTGTYSDGALVAEPTPANSRFASNDRTWLSVQLGLEAFSEEGEDLVEAIRSLAAPFEVSVAGPSAELVDQKDALFGRVPVAGTLIAVATFVLLFLMFGGVLVPIKAIALNLLSLTATFGAIVWIFQDGHLSGLLDFTPTGTIDMTGPILMFCIAFGLSMDYEVFLLSRIKEEYDLTGDNTGSVALGLERTGRIVTAAALLISVVFVAFVTSGVSFIKMFGVGLTLAVLMDATLVRATLVPAFMRLAGRANWWAPAWLRRIQERFAINESVDAAEAMSRPGVTTEGGVGLSNP
ncbi:MAG: MMPL family transporter, partial [Actinomycetota bacterium]